MQQKDWTMQVQGKLLGGEENRNAFPVAFCGGELLLNGFSFLSICCRNTITRKTGYVATVDAMGLDLSTKIVTLILGSANVVLELLEIGVIVVTVLSEKLRQEDVKVR